MEYYVKRLIQCGYSPSDAQRIYRTFIEKDGIMKFISFLNSLEKKHVD